MKLIIKTEYLDNFISLPNKKENIQLRFLKLNLYPKVYSMFPNLFNVIIETEKQIEEVIIPKKTVYKKKSKNDKSENE